MKFRSQKLQQSGDTIVEVLIAAAIISSVLVGAFIVSQKGTSAVRDSQERSEVTQLLQGQVELVRSLAMAQVDTNSGVYKTSGGASKYFCVNGDRSSPSYNQRQDSPGLNSGLPDLEADDFSKYAAACKSLDGQAKQTTDGNYNIAITYDDAAKVFRFYGRWERIDGGKDQVDFTYRIHPSGTAATAATNLAATTDSALITSPTCAKDVNGDCVPILNPQYHFKKTLINSSTSLSAPIASCRWVWDDGVVNTDKCQPGESQPHTWAVPAGFVLTPYDASKCYDYSGSVTLTLTLTNGRTASDTYNTTYPLCY